MKIYIGISRDHSGSMKNVATKAKDDYNQQIQVFKQNSLITGIPTRLSVVECGIYNGIRTLNRFSEKNIDVNFINPIFNYPANGNNTPLFDSVMMLINDFKKVVDYNDPSVSFLLCVVTDGANNHGYTTGYQLAETIKQLQNTDRWTITFRVPRGYAQYLISLGIPAQNILEFDAASLEEWKESTVTTQAATAQFYTNKLRGINSTKGFYAVADTSQLTQKEIRSELSNVSKKVKVIRVTQADDGKQISHFVEEKTGAKYTLGSAFYQLTKKEKLQAAKSIIVWDKLSGEYYTGAEARSMLGLASTGEIKIAPGDTPQFEVFVQSGSVNRKLVGGTKIVVYKDAYPVVTWAGVPV